MYIVKVTDTPSLRRYLNLAGVILFEYRPAGTTPLKLADGEGEAVLGPTMILSTAGVDLDGHGLSLGLDGAEAVALDAHLQILEAKHGRA